MGLPFFTVAAVGKTDPIERGLRLLDLPFLDCPLVGKTDPIERGLRPGDIESLPGWYVGKTDPIERGLRPGSLGDGCPFAGRWKNRPDRKGIKTEHEVTS